MNTKRILLITTAIVCLSCSLSWAQTPDEQNDIQNLINAGFESYKTDGGKGAWNIWCAPAPDMEGSEAVWVSFMDHVVEVDGKPLKAEFIKKMEISPSYCKYFYFLGFEKGPLFIEFSCYKPHDKWEIIYTKMGADAKTILNY